MWHWLGQQISWNIPGDWAWKHPHLRRWLMRPWWGHSFAVFKPSLIYRAFSDDVKPLRD